MSESYGDAYSSSSPSKFPEDTSPAHILEKKTSEVTCQLCQREKLYLKKGKHTQIFLTVSHDAIFEDSVFANETMGLCG